MVFARDWFSSRPSVCRSPHLAKPLSVMRHFMKTVLKTLSVIILIFFIGCNKNKKIAENEKKILLVATQDFKELNEINRTFKIFSDSTFTFTEILKEPNHSKNETFEGFVKLRNDTIKFQPFELDFNNAETAVLKNGFVEFIDGENPGRFKIKQTSLFVRDDINLEKYPNYAVFTFNKNFQKLPNEQKLRNFDLKTSDLQKIDNILKSEFSKNKELKNYSEYIKQIQSVKNENNQNLIFVRCFCKEPRLEESYQYYQTGMHDGGNCTVFILLNLTTEKIEILNIAGNA